MTKPVLSVEFLKLSGWRWRLMTANNRIVGASSEGYLERRKAIANFRKVTGLRFDGALRLGNKGKYYAGAQRSSAR